MEINFDFLKQRIDGIVNDLPRLEAEKELHQTEINNSIQTLIYAQKPIIDAIKKQISMLLPQDNQKEIAPLEEKLAIYNQYFYLNDSVNDPFEEMGFNDLLYKLYKPMDLDDFIDNLKNIIIKAKAIDVSIKASDFNYTYLVSKFMTVFFENINNPDLNNMMKSIFDRLYWKNHSILIDITINVRDILEANNKNIAAHTVKELNNYIKNNNLSLKTIKKEYDELFINVITLSRVSATRIHNMFLNKELNIDDYQDNAQTLLNHRMKFISNSAYELLSKNQEDEFYNNIEELDFNLYEYENYEKYKFLLINLKEITERKATIPAELATKIKTIQALKATNKKNNQQLDKLQATKTKLTARNKEKQAMKIRTKMDDLQLSKENVLSQIRLEYANYDDLLFEDKVCKLVNEKTNVYDAFKVYLNDLNAFRKAIVNNEKNQMPEEEIKELIEQFIRFMKDPRIKIINVINYLNTDDIDIIIEEKYKLSGINIDIVKINDPEYKEMRKSCSVLTNYNYIYRSGWTPFVLKSKFEFEE